MTSRNILNILIDLPKLFALQTIQPLRLAIRKAVESPQTAQEMADMVNKSLKHEIRAGFTHRFIRLMFVTVDDRVFARRYTYGEPSWHSAFRVESQGQIKLDKTIMNIKAYVPDDFEKIIPQVDQAYADSLKRMGARFLLDSAVKPRAQESTIELTLINKPV